MIYYNNIVTFHVPNPKIGYSWPLLNVTNWLFDAMLFNTNFESNYKVFNKFTKCNVEITQGK